ncbi:MAG: class I SAM-dependent methyltransferase [Azoarcus sp.]|jgi:hypothetical protein|nr:class I SAM-dependent methyltransferase [Azoarcus sp.]
MGIDFSKAKGVDIGLQDPDVLPLEDEIIVASAVFEHSELFSILFLEMFRMLKPHGRNLLRGFSGMIS